MNNISMTMDVSSTGSGLSFAVILDGRVVWEGPVSVDTQKITIDIDDDQDGNRQLDLVMSGKHRRHTKINDQGEIVEDLLLHIKNISVDGIAIDQPVWNTAEYQHDFNGTQPPITQSFFGTMGCNGTIKFRFSTPIYLWLLENM